MDLAACRAVHSRVGSFHLLQFGAKLADLLLLGFSLVLRMFRYRMKDGMLVALDENFTMVGLTGPTYNCAED